MANPTDDNRLAWGKHLRESLPAIGALDDIVARRVERQAALDEALGAARDAAAKEQAEVSESVAALNAAADDSGRVLRLIAVKLEALWLEQLIPEAAFRKAGAAAFPGGPQSIPAHAKERHTALARIATALAEHTEADPGGALAKLAGDTAASLVAANDAAKKESEEAREAQAKLEEARNAWDEGYLATKEIIGGLLRDAGRRAELSALFADLAPGAPTPKR